MNSLHTKMFNNNIILERKMLADKQGKNPEDPSAISLFDADPTISPPTPQDSGYTGRLQNSQKLDPESEDRAWLIWYHEKLPFYQQIRSKSSKNEIYEEMRSNWMGMPEHQKAPYYREGVKNRNLNLEPIDFENLNPTTTTQNRNPKIQKSRGILRSQNPTTGRQEILQQKMAKALAKAKKTSESVTTMYSNSEQKSKIESPQNQEPTRFSFITVTKVKNIRPRAHLVPMTIPDMMATSSESKKAPSAEGSLDAQTKVTNPSAVQYENPSGFMRTPESEIENADSSFDTTPDPIIAEGVRLALRLMEPQTPPGIPQHHGLTPLTFPNQPEIKEPFSELEHMDFQMESGMEIEPTLALTSNYPLEDVLEDLGANYFTRIGLDF